MKILVVSQYFDPEPFRITDMVRRFVAQGHEVRVLTGLPNYPEGRVLDDYRKGKRRKEVIHGAEVIRCSLLGRGKGSVRLFLNYVSFAISSSFKAMRLEKDCDVVLIMQYSPITVAHAGYIYARRAKVKSMLYCLDLWPESISVRMHLHSQSLLYKVLVKYCRMIYNRCDILASTSQSFKSYYLDVLGMSRESVHIPQYAEDLFAPTPLQDKEGIDLVFAGNVGKLQSATTMIRAAALLKDRKDIRWHIVGGVSTLDECKTLSSELGANGVVTFYGRRPLEEMPRFYAMADALLITLIKGDEITRVLPGKVQSYMAAERAIIGAADGETMRVVHDAGCGEIASSEDFITLAKIADKLSKDKKALKDYGQMARRYYDNNFSEQIFYDRFNQQFDELLEKRHV